jgi:hypothetical protein
MQLATQPLLLFLLNLFDAVFTVFWVRNGFASEGNYLMSTLLEMGDMPFLGVKILVGAITAIVLWHWSSFKLARYGLAITITLYTALMMVHLVTGLSAYGYISANFINDVALWSSSLI